MLELFSIDRETLNSVLGQMIKCLKPKAKDPIIRRVVYLTFKDGKVSLFATNEMLFILFQDIPVQASDPVEPFAIDLTKLGWLAGASKSERLMFMQSPNADRLIVQGGSLKAEVSYLDRDSYQEYMGDANPMEYPRDDSLYKSINKLGDFRAVVPLLLGCATSDQLHLDGVFTNGSGLFQATDMFRGMELQLSEHQWGFMALVPSDLIRLLDLVGDDAYMYWADSELWMRNADDTVIAYGFTKEPEKFPSEALSVTFKELATECNLKAIIDSASLKEAIDRLKGFFGDDIVCDVSFKKKMVIQGTGSNKDRLKDLVSYKICDGSESVDGFSFQMKLSVIGELPSLFDGEFILNMVSDSRPMYTEAPDLGIKLLLTPFKPRA